MASETVAKAIQILFYLSSTILGLLSLHLRSNETQWLVIHKPITRNQKYFWSLSLLISSILTVFELYLHSTQDKIKNLLTILCHGLLVIAKVGTIPCILALHKNSLEICHLFNCLLSKHLLRIPNSKQLKVKHKTKRSNGYRIYVFALYSFPIGVFLFFVVLIPLVFLVFPCFDDKVISNIIPNPGPIRLVLQVTLFVLQMVSLSSAAAISSIVSTLTLVTLHEIGSHLQNLR